MPPALVTDAVRLLAAGRPGEGGGAPFLSGEAAQAYYGREGAGDVSVAALGNLFSVSAAVAGRDGDARPGGTGAVHTWTVTRVCHP